MSILIFPDESDSKLLAPNSPISFNHGNLWVPSDSVNLTHLGIIPNRVLVIVNRSPSSQTLRSVCSQVLYFQRTRSVLPHPAMSDNIVRKKVLFYERMDHLAQRQTESNLLTRHINMRCLWCFDDPWRFRYTL